MPTLRALVVTCCTALAVAGTATAVAAPAGRVVDRLSPSYGPLGTQLDIHGSGLSTTTGVTVGKSAQVAPSQPATDNDVVVTVPADATTGHVRLYQATGPASVGPTFTVQQATRAVVKLSHRTTTFPGKLTVTGTLTNAVTGRGAGGHHARLQKRFRGSSRWSRVAHTPVATTGHRGRAVWSVTPGANLTYRVLFAATHEGAAARVTSRAVGVHPRLRLSVPATFETRSATELRGSVRPRIAGALSLQRRVGSHWRTVKRVHPHHGSFATTITAGTPGGYRFRVTRSAGHAYLAAASSPAAGRAVARSLHLGDSGADVKALQRRLRHLHYDVGPASASYGYDLLHAVTAFEKVQGLHADGVTGTAVWSALAHPKRPHLKHPISGATAVEVDLSRQILMIAKDGHVWRILDTSTAGGYYYTDQNGNSVRAVTPAGHFAIRYKQNGTVHARLGTLYRPSYFNYDGYAIHGEGNGNSGSNVPPYPNSHGCVRITDLAVDRYYNLFAVGMSVWIYQ